MKPWLSLVRYLYGRLGLRSSDCLGVIGCVYVCVDSCLVRFEAGVMRAS